MTQTLAPPTPPDDREPPPATTPTEPNTATRYLCVGAYLDEVFRESCLREVYYQGRRFVAPSRGFDLVTVLDACVRARNLDMVRDGSIVLVLAVATYLNWLSAGVVVATIVCLRVTAAALRLARVFLARAEAGTAVDTTKSPRRGLMMLLGWAATVIVLAVLVAKTISVPPAAAPGAPHVSLNAAVLLASSVFVLPAVFAFLRQLRIERFTIGGRPPQVRRTSRIDEIDEEQGGNTVVYSDFEPFLGSGDVVSTWSFAQRLVQKASDVPGAQDAEGKREFDRPPFTAKNIVDYVRDNLETLTVETAPELSIPHTSVEDRIFQSARELGEKSVITGAHVIDEVIRNPTTPRRHYLACQGISWGGDIVTTVHIHLAVQGKSLYLEATSTLLGPCKERWRVVDTASGTGPRAWRRAVIAAVRGTPRTIARAPGNLVRTLTDMAGSRSGTGGSGSRLKDGAGISVRHLGSGDKLRNFTQVQDVLKFRKLIENRVYAHVLDYLDEHDVDTSEVRARRATILNNNGVFVTGNMTVTGNSSVSNQTDVGQAPQAD